MKEASLQSHLEAISSTAGSLADALQYCASTCDDITGMPVYVGGMLRILEVVARGLWEKTVEVQSGCNN